MDAKMVRHTVPSPSVSLKVAKVTFVKMLYLNTLSKLTSYSTLPEYRSVAVRSDSVTWEHKILLDYIIF